MLVFEVTSSSSSSSSSSLALSFFLYPSAFSQRQSTMPRYVPCSCIARYLHTIRRKKNSNPSLFSWLRKTFSQSFFKVKLDICMRVSAEWKPPIFSSLKIQALLHFRVKLINELLSDCGKKRVKEVIESGRERERKKKDHLD